MKNTHKTSTCTKGRTTTYNPPSALYKERAQKIEKDSHNTNIFNGRNLSDNTPASHFYQCKARPHLRDQDLRVATQGRRIQEETLQPMGQGEYTYKFTNQMLEQAYGDNVSIKACFLPSALVEVPRISERYET